MAVKEIVKKNLLQLITLGISFIVAFTILKFKVDQVEALTIENKVKIEAQQVEINQTSEDIATIKEAILNIKDDNKDTKEALVSINKILLSQQNK